jgi:DNA-directed RNA polymerase specialized sigma24 family protein
MDRADDEAGAERRRQRQAHDAGMVNALREGDPTAFGQLYDRWSDAVFDVAARLVRRRPDAVEVSVETFEVAWRRLPTLEPPEALAGWLLRLARNAALVRHHSARPGMPELRVDRPGGPLTELVDVVTGSELPASDGLTAATDAEEALRDPTVEPLIWAAAGTLTARDLGLLDLHLRHGLAPGESASALGLNPGAAERQVTQLRDKLATAVRAVGLWNGGEPACDQLTAKLRRSRVETFDIHAVRLIERHARGCATCEPIHQLVVDPVDLFAAIPLVAVEDDERSKVAVALLRAGVPLQGSGKAKLPAAPAAGGTDTAAGERWRLGSMVAAASAGASTRKRPGSAGPVALDDGRDARRLADTIELPVIGGPAVAADILRRGGQPADAPIEARAGSAEDEARERRLAETIELPAPGGPGGNGADHPLDELAGPGGPADPADPVEDEGAAAVPEGGDEAGDDLEVAAMTDDDPGTEIGTGIGHSGKQAFSFGDVARHWQPAAPEDESPADEQAAPSPPPPPAAFGGADWSAAPFAPDDDDDVDAPEAPAWGPPAGAGTVEDEDTADDLPVVAPMPVVSRPEWPWENQGEASGAGGWEVAPVDPAVRSSPPPPPPPFAAGAGATVGAARNGPNRVNLDEDEADIASQLLRPFALVGAAVALVLLVTTAVLLTRSERTDMATDRLITDQSSTTVGATADSETNSRNQTTVESTTAGTTVDSANPGGGVTTTVVAGGPGANPNGVPGGQVAPPGGNSPSPTTAAPGPPPTDPTPTIRQPPIVRRFGLQPASIQAPWAEGSGPVLVWTVTNQPDYSVRIMGPPFGTTVYRGFNSGAAGKPLPCPVAVEGGMCNPPPGPYSYDLVVHNDISGLDAGIPPITLQVTAPPPPTTVTE